MVLLRQEGSYKSRYTYIDNGVLTPGPTSTASAKCPETMQGVPIRKLYADALSCTRKPGARAMLRRYKRAVGCMKGRMQAGRRQRQTPWYQALDTDGHGFAIALAMHHAAVCRFMLQHRY